MDRATETPLSGVRDVWSEGALVGLGGLKLPEVHFGAPTEALIKMPQFQSSTENLFA